MYEITERNRKFVTESAIAAKAAVRLDNGKVKLVVVFEESTLRQFYWIFEARSARSPRKTWKPAGSYGRDAFGTREFGAFLSKFASRGVVISARVVKPKRMSALYVKTNHESIDADWTPQAGLQSSDFMKVQKKADQAFHSSTFYFNRRDRMFDDPPQNKDDVLVYDDWCEECGKRHQYAHFPDGKRQCKIGFVEMKKHPGYEYRGYMPKTGFKFVSRTAAFVPQGA